jgi:hypothetical protein
VTALDGAGHAPGPEGFYAEQARARLVRDLDALFRAVLPHQWVRTAVDAALSEACPLITPAAHSAAIRRETDWQGHWLAKCQDAEREAFRLRQALDVTAVERVRAALQLVADLYPSRTAKHDEDCHTRHAACLAVRVRAALTERT